MRASAWRPSPTFVVCMATAGLLVTLAVAFARPDILALGLPFLCAGTWMIATRPTCAPTVHTAVSNRTPTEGTAHQWQLAITDAEGVDTAHLALTTDTNVHWQHGPTTLSVPMSENCLDLRRSFEPTRWGQAEIGQGNVVLSSPWSAFYWGPIPLRSWSIRVLPAPAAFEVDAAVPRPVGLVGRNRSARPGDGAEFADVRLFRAGDRLRHVHWPISARTGQLHVRTNYAELDTQVTILLDASLDIGPTGGVHGAASSLDVSLRAAASISAQFLAVGERVAMQVVGVPDILYVPPGVGRRHQRRILDTLSLVNPVGATISQRTVRIPGGTGLFVLISPLLSEVPMQIAALASGRGLGVIVLDVLDADQLRAGARAASTDEVAIRLRLLERAQEIDAIRARGVPVTTWQGAGSLDVVLRQLARRPARRVAGGGR